MSEERVREKKKRGKVVLNGHWLRSVFMFMESEKALPTGSVEIVNIKDDSIRTDILIIDFDRGKFTFSQYSYDRESSEYTYLIYTYNLNKVDLDTFIKGIIVKSYGMLKEDFETAIANMFKNEYLKKKFHKILEDSSGLRQILLNRVDLIEVLRKYDVALATKLLA